MPSSKHILSLAPTQQQSSFFLVVFSFSLAFAFELYPELIITLPYFLFCVFFKSSTKIFKNKHTYTSIFSFWTLLYIDRWIRTSHWFLCLSWQKSKSVLLQLISHMLQLDFYQSDVRFPNLICFQQYKG